MLFCSTIAFLMVRVLKVVKSVNMPRRDYVRRVMPIGALYAASLWLSNSAYLHLSVSFIQMTKALMPGLVYTTVRRVGRFRRSLSADTHVRCAGRLHGHRDSVSHDRHHHGGHCHWRGARPVVRRARRGLSDS